MSFYKWMMVLNVPVLILNIAVEAYWMAAFCGLNFVMCWYLEKLDKKWLGEKDDGSV